MRVEVSLYADSVIMEKNPKIGTCRPVTTNACQFAEYKVIISVLLILYILATCLETES